MIITPATPENIRKAAEIIRNGGLVAFPTETVYGLGADALNSAAVSRIFEAKDRPFFDPLIVHISLFSDLARLVRDPDEKALKLAEKVWPGPLTIVLQKSGIVPDIVTAGLPTVAVRMPANDIARELIKQSGTAIAAPSANPFGYISPTTAEHVRDQLGSRVDMILDGGNCSIGIESTIIKFVNGPAVLRYGGLSIEEIEKITGKIQSSIIESEKTESPGQLPYHYSPSTPVILVDEIYSLRGERSGLLAFTPPERNIPVKKIEILSHNGDLREAAANLFSSLHALDAACLDVIYAEKVPLHGLGRAIMDRLTRASRKNKLL